MIEPPYIEIKLKYPVNLSHYPGIHTEREAMEFDLEQVRDNSVSLNEMLDYNDKDENIEYRLVTE